jgi:RNA polymerase primary sigma factor
MKVEAEKVEKAYNKFKGRLTPREADIITRFYGIGAHVRHTLVEIGWKYQVTRERIRQIKDVALKKMNITIKK